MFPYKKCVTEKRTLVNKLKLHLFYQFLSIAFNKLPCGWKEEKRNFAMEVILSVCFKSYFLTNVPVPKDRTVTPFLDPNRLYPPLSFS